MTLTTRFAPSPTGHLHLGHAYSALFAAAAVEKSHGQFLVRIEDIDSGRCRKEFEDQIFEDLKWLGLSWETPVRRQSEHMADYKAQLDILSDMGILYPCFCTRADIRREIEACGHAPHDIPSGPDGPLYPGTCLHLTKSEREDRIASAQPFALRLHMSEAIKIAGPLEWHDLDQGRTIARPEIFGDVVLARKETPTSYHLAVTLDDHLQDVTLVTRGEDLFHASHIHSLLQSLFGLNKPQYHHHRLLQDEDGKRFAKRDNAVPLKEIKESGTTAVEIRQQLGFS
mgnify:CR=1 FL=1